MLTYPKQQATDAPTTSTLSPVVSSPAGYSSPAVSSGFSTVLPNGTYTFTGQPTPTASFTGYPTTTPQSGSAGQAVAWWLAAACALFGGVAAL